MKFRILLLVFVAVVVAAPVQAWPPSIQLDSMDNIAARPWLDLREPGEGTGMMSQATWADQVLFPPTGNLSATGEGTGGLKVDFGVTNDSLGVPNPSSGYDYLGNFVGVGAAGGAFSSTGGWLGHYDREISAPFMASEIGGGGGPLDSTAVMFIDSYQPIAGGPAHIRELQLYDTVAGTRNCYSVVAEADAKDQAQGWTTYTIYLNNPVVEELATLATVNKVTFFVTEWSSWNDGVDWIHVAETGLPIILDNFRMVPEPATMIMLGLGGLALLRRKKA